MPVTRILLLLSVVLYALLPLPWLLWRPEGLFYRFDPSQLPPIAALMGVFALAWALGERFHTRTPWFAEKDVGGPSWPVARFAIFAGLLCSLAANGTLHAMDALVIDESVGRVRVPLVTTLASAHIFSLIFSACLLFTSRPQKRDPILLLLAAASTVMTIGVGLLEGRRTAVALPLVVFAALALIGGHRRALRAVLWSLPIVFLLVAATTSLRLSADDLAFIDEGVLMIVGDALVGRLGNALIILDPILDHMRTERLPLDPHTVQSLLSSLPTLGLVEQPFETGFGNALGRELGMLPPENDYTGINSGWVGELLLLGGMPAVAAGGVLLGMLAGTAWHLLSIRHPAGLFLRIMVVIFVVSGFQMEVTLPAISLLRAILIALVLAVCEYTLARVRERP